MKRQSDDFGELIREARRKYADGNVNHAIDCIEKAMHVTKENPADADGNAEQILDVVRIMMEDKNDDAAAACLLNVNANLPLFSPEIQALVCMKSGECVFRTKMGKRSGRKWATIPKQNGRILNAIYV